MRKLDKECEEIGFSIDVFEDTVESQFDKYNTDRKSKDEIIEDHKRACNFLGTGRWSLRALIKCAPPDARKECLKRLIDIGKIIDGKVIFMDETGNPVPSLNLLLFNVNVDVTLDKYMITLLDSGEYYEIDRHSSRTIHLPDIGGD